MKIDSITFGRTKSLPNEYGNIRIGFSASLTEGEDWQEKLKELEVMVDDELAARLSNHRRIGDIEDRVASSKHQLWELGHSIQSKQRVLKQLVDLLEKHGVEMPDREFMTEVMDYDPFAEECQTAPGSRAGRE